MINDINSTQHQTHADGFIEALADRTSSYHPDPAPAMRKPRSVIRSGLPPAGCRKINAGEWTKEHEAASREAFRIAEETRRHDDLQRLRGMVTLPAPHPWSKVLGEDLLLASEVRAALGIE